MLLQYTKVNFNDPLHNTRNYNIALWAFLPECCISQIRLCLSFSPHLTIRLYAKCSFLSFCVSQIGLHLSDVCHRSLYVGDMSVKCLSQSVGQMSVSVCRANVCLSVSGKCQFHSIGQMSVSVIGQIWWCVLNLRWMGGG